LGIASIPHGSAIVRARRYVPSGPDCVATVAAVLAVGALAFVAVPTRSSPTVDDVTAVVPSITVPATLACELARR
jgi:hypothetical protein